MKYEILEKVKQCISGYAIIFEQESIQITRKTLKRNGTYVCDQNSLSHKELDEEIQNDLPRLSALSHQDENFQKRSARCSPAVLSKNYSNPMQAMEMVGR